MKALDRDLPERIVRTVGRGESMPSVAARFGVSPSAGQEAQVPPAGHRLDRARDLALRPQAGPLARAE